MANVLLSWQNHVDIDGAIMSASSVVSNFPEANLSNPIIGRRFRTTSLTAYVDIDFLSDKTIGVLALRFPRDTAFPTSGTVQHLLDANGGTPGSGATYDSTAVSINTTSGYGYHVHALATSKTARYWRFAFNVSGVSFIDVGRAWAGEAWQPEANFSFGVEDDWMDLSEVSRSLRSGAEFVDERERQRSLAFSLDVLSNSEQAQLAEMQRISGIAKQILIVKDPDSPSTGSLIGRMQRTTPIRHRSLPLYSKAFEILESP